MSGTGLVAFSPKPGAKQDWQGPAKEQGLFFAQKNGPLPFTSGF
jgi:hypothetical protein